MNLARPTRLLLEDIMWSNIALIIAVQLMMGIFIAVTDVSIVTRIKNAAQVLGSMFQVLSNQYRRRQGGGMGRTFPPLNWKNMQEM